MNERKEHLTGEQAEAGRSLDRAAEEYVRLCFALERHLPSYVDSYFGPDALKEEGKRGGQTPEQVKEQALSLQEKVETLGQGMLDQALGRRATCLAGHLRSMAAASRMLVGEKRPFDEESRAIYHAVCPPLPAEELSRSLSRIAALLPGTEPLARRMESFRRQFEIPKEKLKEVLQVAIDEARRRTAEHIPLPEGESFSVELVTGQPWSGYNWFQGQGRSLIQVNTDLPVELDLVVLLACHEGYPGHHMLNLLHERLFYHQKGWVEHAIWPLFGPDALLAEGSANFGIEVAFPSMAERIAFERNVLCPLAGLDGTELERYHEILRLNARLGYAEVDIARQYLDGQLSQEEALQRLIEGRLCSRPRAEQQLDFFRCYRAYVISYHLGCDLVREWVENQGGTPGQVDRRWHLFQELLSSPLLPEDLVGATHASPLLPRGQQGSE